MAWWNPFSWSSVPAHPSPDLTEFDRATWALGELTAGDMVQLGTFGMGCRADTPPQDVPVTVLDAIGYHPVVYAGEAVVTGPASDPELFYGRAGRGADRRTVDETDAWLRPLMTLQRAPLLPQIARGFAYGCIPIVLDYDVEDLTIKVASEVEEVDPATGETLSRMIERNRNLPGHVHYVRSHELWPGDVQLRVRNDRLIGIVDLLTGVEYGGEDLEDPGQARGYASIWDPQFGRWRGHGSRRRVYKDWFEEGQARLWEIRYLERGVDLPRVGYAPDGEITLGGKQVSAIKLLRAQLMSLRNGSVITLPSTLATDNQPAWRVQTLEGADRHAIFQTAIDSRGARMLWASLLAGGKLDKATEEAAMDSVQRVCDFAAATLTRMANTVLRLKYGKGAPVVQYLANDVPKRKLRLVQQVFADVANATQHLEDGRVYTLAELVDPEILDQLGIKSRSVETAAHQPAAPEATAEAFFTPDQAKPGAKPGAPLDVGSNREQRRDTAQTVDGEQDTGGTNVDRQEQV